MGQLRTVIHTVYLQDIMHWCDNQQNKRPVTNAITSKSHTSWGRQGVPAVSSFARYAART